MEEGITIVLDNNEILSGVCGVNDQNLKAIAGLLGGRIHTRGNEISLTGVDEAGQDRFKTVIDSLINAVKEGDIPSTEYVEALTGAKSSASVSALRDNLIQIPQGFVKVFPRSKNQALYIRGMREHEICFCSGPAGTGKTYLAIAEALRLVLSKKLRKLVLTRPVVEAGESLGYLPGDLAQKINPYLRPLYDAMEALISYDTIHHLEETRAIEIAPLAYMRGRTLDDSFIILDEAQNTTHEQMKMFLTRLGFGSKMVITGDITQIDLPVPSRSGLVEAVKVLKNIDDIAICRFTEKDVVRHRLVQDIVKAYEKISARTEHKPEKPQRKERRRVQIKTKFQQRNRPISKNPD